MAISCFLIMYDLEFLKRIQSSKSASTVQNTSDPTSSAGGLSVHIHKPPSLPPTRP